jgi:hypothetical protein
MKLLLTSAGISNPSSSQVRVLLSEVRVQLANSACPDSRSMTMTSLQRLVYWRA